MSKSFAGLFVVWLLGSSAIAQQVVLEPITGIRVLVLPLDGDAMTVAAVAARDTGIGPGSPSCNQPQVSAGAVPLINPGFMVVDDPYHTGATCRAPLPAPLPEGSYRAVGQFLTAAASCVASGSSDIISPCISARSEVGQPPFSIANIRVRPGAPTGVLLIP